MTAAAQQPVLLDAAEQFDAWSRGACGTAFACRTKGNDPYGVALASARAEVYAEAARIAQFEHDSATLTAKLMAHAVECSVREGCLTWRKDEFDAAGLSYVKARAWQLCAWHIAPTLPEVQEKWD